LINEAQDYLINNGDEEPLNSELPSVMFSFLKAVSVSLPNANINLLDVAMFTWQKSPHFVIIYDYLYRSIVVDAVTSHDTELQLALSAISHIRNDDSQYTYMLLTALAIKWKENEQQVDWMALFQFAITKLGTQSIREEIKVAIIDMMSCLIANIPACQNAAPCTAKLIEILHEWCDDTSPDNVRVAIAKLSGLNFSCLSSINLSEPNILCSYWYMMIMLLQDVEEDVRMAMCLSLSHICEDDANGRESLMCNQFVLHKLIQSIPCIYSSDVAINLLLSLIPLDLPATATSSDDKTTITSLLFEEDQSNSFAEPILLVEYILESLHGAMNNLKHVDEQQKSKLVIQHYIEGVCSLSCNDSYWFIEKSVCKCLIINKLIYDKLIFAF
jgi:hypothetical protein